MALPTAWQGDQRCGGHSSKRGDKDLVVPRLLGQAREEFFSLKEHQPRIGRTSQHLDAIAQEAVFQSWPTPPSVPTAPAGSSGKPSWPAPPIALS